MLDTSSGVVRPATPQSFTSALEAEKSQRAFERLDYLFGKKALPAGLPRPASASRRRQQERELRGRREGQRFGASVEYAKKGDARKTSISASAVARKQSDSAREEADEGFEQLDWAVASRLGSDERLAEAASRRATELLDAAARQRAFAESYARRVVEAEVRKQTQQAVRRMAREASRTSQGLGVEVHPDAPARAREAHRHESSDEYDYSSDVHHEDGMSPSKSPLSKAIAWSRLQDNGNNVDDADLEEQYADTLSGLRTEARDGSQVSCESSALLASEIDSPQRRKSYHGGSLASHLASNATANSREEVLGTLHRLITQKLSSRRGDSKVWLRAALRPFGSLGSEASTTTPSRLADLLRALNVRPSQEEFDMLVSAHAVSGTQPPMLSVSSLVEAIEPKRFGGGLGVKDSGGGRMDVLLEEDLPRLRDIFREADIKSENARRSAAPQLALSALREAAHSRRCGVAALRTLLRQLAETGCVAASKVRSLLERSSAASLSPSATEALVKPFLTKRGEVDCSLLARAVLGSEDPELPWQREEERSPSLPPPEHSGAPLPDMLPNELAQLIRARIERHRRVPRDLAARHWAFGILGNGKRTALISELKQYMRIPPLALDVPRSSIERLVEPYLSRRGAGEVVVDVRRFVDECLFPEEGFLEPPKHATPSRRHEKTSNHNGTAKKSLESSFSKFNDSHGFVSPKVKGAWY